MKPVVFIFLASALLSVPVQAAQSIGGLYVRSIELREEGRHALYFNAGVVIDEGCTLSDRVVIDEAMPGAQAILDAAMLAREKSYPTSIRVDGCIELVAGAGMTAPLLVRFKS